MRNLQILEDPQWKGHCIKDLSGLKRLKRKSREVIKPLNGYQTFKVDLKVDAGLKGGAQPGPPLPETMEGVSEEEDALDLSSVATQGKKGSPVTGSPEGKPYGDQRLQPRMVVCQRTPETSYLSVSQVAYDDDDDDSSPDPCASPRKRLGEPAGVSSEIKAIQQTRRLLANARERTRVHTISAAFEALRKQRNSQKLAERLNGLALAQNKMYNANAWKGPPMT